MSVKDRLSLMLDQSRPVQIETNQDNWKLDDDQKFKREIEHDTERENGYIVFRPRAGNGDIVFFNLEVAVLWVSRGRRKQYKAEDQVVDLQRVARAEDFAIGVFLGQ